MSGEVKSRRGAEYIITDPFIDAAFVKYLISSQDRLEVLKRQARVYSETGDIGEGLTTFHIYKNEVKSYIINKFKSIYNERMLEKEISKIGDEKAKRAWRVVITLLASQQLMSRAGAGAGEFLPKEYGRLENLASILDTLIEEKTRQRGVGAPNVVKNVIKKYGRELVPELAPLLWWINLVMESEVFEGILKYHFLVLKKSQALEFAKIAEVELSEIEGHKADLEYMEQEMLKGLLSRCAELRGQYINKLQTAILFIKLWRRRIKNPEGWEWFLKNEILTYALSVYLTELQSYLGFEKRKLNISTLLSPKSGIYAGPSSALSSLILLSPIFMQYVIEASNKVIITPADIIVAVLRIAKSSMKAEDYVIGVRNIVEEILKFWHESNILQRLKLYTQSEMDPKAIISELENRFVTSLALIINTGIRGIIITTRERPEFHLPPRMDGFDSLYIRTEQLLPILNGVWV